MNLVQTVIMSLIAGVFTLIFGIRYLRNKEIMALIEKNRDITDSTKPSSFLTLGVIMIGASIGIFVGLMLTTYVVKPNEDVFAFLISIMFFTGLGFIVSFFLAKKLK